MKIDNGAGSGGYSARVDSSNRLRTYGVTRDVLLDAAEYGEAFNINTGTITLTSASESGVLYLKNTGTRDIIIDSIIPILAPSTGGSASDSTEILVYRNPTSGTLISNATAISINSNRNFGSSNSLECDCYKGTEGATISGSTHIESFISPGSRSVIKADLVLEKDSSLAISIIPNDSNTSMKTKMALACHLKQAE